MTTGRPLRFGLIGVDSSHALQFTRLFGDGRTGRVRGGTVVAAWQGPTSPDFPPSRDRNASNAAALTALGIDLLPSPEAVAAVSDALLLVSSDARTRHEQFASISAFGMPVYVDTRFSRTPDEAEDMLRTADTSGCLVLSGSPKRFTAAFRTVVTELPRPRAAELTGPLVVQPGHPGLSWYGVHLVDLAVAALGPDCIGVEARGTDLQLSWADGRSATIGGPAEWDPWTQGRLHTNGRQVDFEITADENMLIGLLESIVVSCRSGAANIDAPEILAIRQIIAAGNQALRTQTAVPVTVGAT